MGHFKGRILLGQYRIVEVRVRGEPEPVSLSNRRAVFLVSFLSLPVSPYPKFVQRNRVLGRMIWFVFEGITNHAGSLRYRLGEPLNLYRSYPNLPWSNVAVETIVVEVDSLDTSPIAECFSDIAFTVKFYCACDVAKTFCNEHTIDAVVFRAASDS